MKLAYLNKVVDVKYSPHTDSFYGSVDLPEGVIAFQVSDLSEAQVAFETAVLGYLVYEKEVIESG